MPIRALFTFLTPLSVPYHAKTPSFAIKPKHKLILCQSAESQVPVSEPKSSGFRPDPEGMGAAAPTRGDRFIERQQAHEAAKLVIRESNKEKRKKKKQKDKPLKIADTLVACCYGCGAPLQTTEMDAPGYVDPDTYELKKKHHQLRTIICKRCRLLSHGHMITAVGGHGGYPGGKQFILAEELRKKLSHLRHEKALIVKLIDIVDFNGSFLAHVRDLVGANPIILVATKVDLLPKGTDLNCVGDWIVEATVKKKLNVLSVHLISSKSLLGIAGVASEIQKEKKGRDVYILGAANVGKSAFINALLKTMALRDPAAAAAQKYKPMQSAVPGTTLGPIQIDAFLGGGKLYDTPGVHLHHRQAAVVHSEDLPSLAPQSRLRGQTFHLPTMPIANVTAERFEIESSNGFSIFWGGLVRVDIFKILPDTCLTFYGPKALQVHIVPTEAADEFYQKEVGSLLTPPTGEEKVKVWKGLETCRRIDITFEEAEQPANDVAISGLGWIAVEPIRRSSKDGGKNVDENERHLVLVIRVPKPVEVFVRPPMPVGIAGAEWYQFRELSEEEEEVRPKWHF